MPTGISLERLKASPPAGLLSSYFWKLKFFLGGTVSQRFWHTRYKQGGTSGPGSYGRLAEFKTSVLNGVIEAHNVSSVLDLGCGDGNQIRKLHPIRYIGIDVSTDAIDRCRKQHKEDPTKSFICQTDVADESADMTISLDVIYHLVEDSVFEAYMRDLFDRSERLVLIYSSNFEQLCLNPFARLTHVRHRAFTKWIRRNRPNWTLEEHISNPYKKVGSGSSENVSYADFYLYRRGI